MSGLETQEKKTMLFTIIALAVAGAAIAGAWGLMKDSLTDLWN